MQKKWYLSKTIWANLIGLCALAIQSQTGFIITPELQSGLLVVINLGLRVVTKEELVW